MLGAHRRPTEKVPLNLIGVIPAQGSVRTVPGPTSCIGPRSFLADLPSPSTKRWVIRRKAEVVSAVRGGLFSLEEVCERYGLTVDEFMEWQKLFDQHGLRGLRSTRVKQYRTAKTGSLAK